MGVGAVVELAWAFADCGFGYGTYGYGTRRYGDGFGCAFDGEGTGNGYGMEEIETCT